MYSFEICANSIQSCEVAEIVKADRVELCAALTEGGTTPSYGMIQKAREICKNVKLHVIIRPRGSDFLYDQNELAVMEEDLKIMQELKVDGVVFGCLNEDGAIDINNMERLLKHCDGLSVTFHRAFDVVKDPFKALEDIIKLNRVDRILTSGSAPDALTGANMLAQLQNLAQGKVSIMAGAGVSPNNIAQIAQISKVSEFHFSGKGTTASLMKYHHPSVFMGLPNMDEYAKPITSLENVKATMLALGEKRWQD